MRGKTKQIKFNFLIFQILIVKEQKKNLKELQPGTLCFEMKIETEKKKMSSSLLFFFYRLIQFFLKKKCLLKFYIYLVESLKHQKTCFLTALYTLCSNFHQGQLCLSSFGVEIKYQSCTGMNGVN